MCERDAEAVAYVFGGRSVRQTDGPSEDDWLVLFARHDGRVVALTDVSVEEYDDLQAFHDGEKCGRIAFL